MIFSARLFLFYIMLEKKESCTYEIFNKCIHDLQSFVFLYFINVLLQGMNVLSSLCLSRVFVSLFLEEKIYM